MPSTSGMSETASCPASPVADNVSALPSPTSSPSSSRWLCSLDASPCMPAVILYFSRCYSIKLKMFYFSVFVFMYYLYENYYTPITIQYYIASCVSRVPLLTLLDLWTSWTYALSDWNLLLYRGLTVFGIIRWLLTPSKYVYFWGCWER